MEIPGHFSTEIKIYKLRRPAALAKWRALVAQIAAREMAVACMSTSLRYSDTAI
jgi:hypothetical protein